MVQRQSGLIQLTFVLNTSGKDTPKANQWQTLLHQLREEHNGLWHSLWLNFNDRSTNAILGPQWSLVWGEKWLWETFGEVLVCYGPANFGQANIPLFESMLTCLRELIPDQARVAEFYAGVGVIGLSIASRCQWVRCSEMNPHAEVCFEQARSRLPLSQGVKMTFFTGSTHNTLSLMEEATTVIVDPPRKGLEATFFSALKAASTVKQLIYISCGWEAFKRDCHQLISEGWGVQSVDGYLFFPGSNHFELLVSFERKFFGS